MDVQVCPSFPPGNPFIHDSFCMGNFIGKNVVVLYPKHISEHQGVIYIVDMVTGERIAVTFDAPRDPWEMTGAERAQWKREKLRVALEALDAIGSSPWDGSVKELWEMTGDIFQIRDAMRRTIKGK